MQEAFVGFYWTLPVNWANFRSLPKDAEAAADKSRTVRYQRERVRRFVEENRGVLVDEIVFMDTRPDRATEAIEEALLRAQESCNRRRATLLYVRFEDRNYWRANPHLHRYTRELGLDPVALAPDPVAIDGRLFDPMKHFRRWRQIDARSKAALQETAQTALAEVLQQVGVDYPGRYKEIADRLNAAGVKTGRGGVWTAEGVRKTVTRGGLIETGQP
jgi:hypothetical protein